MSKWREVTLENITSLISRGVTPKYSDDGFQILNQKCIRNYAIDFSKAKRTCDNKSYREDKFLEIGDILINSTGTGTLGRVSIFDKKYNNILVDTHITIVRTKDDISPFYLGYYLHLIEDTLVLLGRGATNQQELNKGVLEKLKIKIPDLETQEKIANVLSSYDNLIENNNRRIELLENMAEEIYKEWFVRMRFPGHEKTKFEKGIPEGWEVKKIGDIANFRRGKNLRIADAVEGNIPVIAGGIDPSCYHNESNTSAPVITVSASGANAGYTKLNYIDVWASDCSYIDIVDTDLIYYIYLLMKVSSNEILNLQTGSAQPHVYAKDINNFKFLKPQEHLIIKINNLSKKIFDEISLLNRQNENLMKQRDMLLPRLMNGSVEVK